MCSLTVNKNNILQTVSSGIPNLNLHLKVWCLNGREFLQCSKMYSGEADTYGGEI